MCSLSRNSRTGVQPCFFSDDQTLKLTTKESNLTLESEAGQIALGCSLPSWMRLWNFLALCAALSLFQLQRGDTSQNWEAGQMALVPPLPSEIRLQNFSFTFCSVLANHNIIILYYLHCKYHGFYHAPDSMVVLKIPNKKERAENQVPH